MVSTSARTTGGPWFDSRLGHDRFCVSVSISFSVKTGLNDIEMKIQITALREIMNLMFPENSKGIPLLITKIWALESCI